MVTTAKAFLLWWAGMIYLRAKRANQVSAVVWQAIADDAVDALEIAVSGDKEDALAILALEMIDDPTVVEYIEDKIDGWS